MRLFCILRPHENPRIKTIQKWLRCVVPHVQHSRKTTLQILQNGKPFKVPKIAPQWPNFRSTNFTISWLTHTHRLPRKMIIHLFRFKIFQQKDYLKFSERLSLWIFWKVRNNYLTAIGCVKVVQFPILNFLRLCYCDADRFLFSCGGVCLQAGFPRWF